MVYKSLHELAPQYMCNLFTRVSQLASRCLRNTLTDLRLRKKSSIVDKFIVGNESLEVVDSLFSSAMRLTRQTHVAKKSKEDWH